MTTSPKSDGLALFHPAVRDWFTASFDAPTRPQALGWPSIARGESTLILAPTGSGKTLAAFLWCLDRVMFAPPPPKLQRCRVLYVSPLKALAVDVERNLRAPLAGISRVATARGDAFLHPGDRGPHRRYPRRRARAVSARAGGHPHHHSRIAVSAADLERARRAALGRNRDHRRDSRARPDQARRAPRALRRTARRVVRPAVAAHRPVRDAAAARRSRPVSRRRGPIVRPRRRPAARVERRRPVAVRQAVARQPTATGEAVDAPATPLWTRLSASSPSVGAGSLPPGDRRGRRSEEGARAHHRGTRRGHGQDYDGRRDPERAGVGRRHAAVHLGGHPSEAAGADSRPSLDADLREQPPPGRAARRRPERAGRGNARPLTPRIDRAPAADRGRGSAEVRLAPRAGRHLVARARHRHGRDRPRRANRSAAVGRERTAAHRPRRASGQRRQHRRDLPEVPGRPASPAPPSRRPCTTARSKPPAIPATRSISSPSRSSR